MNTILVVIISIGYLALIFAIAQYAETMVQRGRKSWLANPYVYALSMAVYCTAWTYYGSVGRAASSGIEFLAIYTGPSLTAPLWWIILRKIIRISKIQRLTTIADFLSSRYGKSILVGAAVTVISVIGIIPYIALQIKAISESYKVLIYGIYTNQQGLTQSVPFWRDGELFIVIGLIFFVILFGTRQIETTEKHEGMVVAIAFESVVKLFAFICVGVFVVYGLFNGLGDIFNRAVLNPELVSAFTLKTPVDSGKWFWMNLLSALAIFCLPRQYQVSVVENVNEKHLNKAMWVFPLYLLLINLFVLPIALGGKLLLGSLPVNADTYVLALPLSEGNEVLAILTYIGGFSAATSMIIVSTIALSTMLSNNLIIPMLAGPELMQLFPKRLMKVPVYIRRFSIIIVLMSAYIYVKTIAQGYTLVSIGLVSFAAVGQFAPSLLGGLFWKKGNQKGALCGLIVGFIIWFYTLIVPSFVNAGFLSTDLSTYGLFHMGWLRPSAIFGLEDMDYLSHSLFWSLGMNTGLYMLISLFTRQTTIERNQAEIFVDIFKYSKVYENAVVWKGTVYLPDVHSLMSQFLGEKRTTELLNNFARQYQIDLNAPGEADGRLVAFAEKMLAGVIGTGSARIMVASVVQAESLKMDDIVDILHETQQVIELNKKLEEKSEELQKATAQLRRINNQLKQADLHKDDFLSTVTHELRTPITSIRALSEILLDNPDLDQEEKNRFLETIVKESERISKLISQILDLEKYESGKFLLTLLPFEPEKMIKEAIAPLIPIAKEKRIDIHLKVESSSKEIYADEGKITQVINNLVSNAIKFAETTIEIKAEVKNSTLCFSVKDDGKGIPAEYHSLIFDRFYQARNQSTRKPLGSGLGLAISQKIIQLHEGRIKVESEMGKGAEFTFSIPVARTFS